MVKLEKIGLQLYTIRKYMGDEENIKRSFEKLKKMGIDEVQTADCAIPFEKYGQLAKDAGLTIVGTHDDFNRMCNDPIEAMRLHDCLDTKLMGIGGFWAEDVAAYKTFIEKANKLCEVIGPKGYKFTYHHHSHEFMKLGDEKKRPIDMLIEGLNPQYTSFVCDTYWIQNAGGDIRWWLEYLKGRIDVLHLKEMGFGEKGSFITEVGNGNINWAGVLETAVSTGIKHFVIEQDDYPGDPFDSVQQSVDYLRANFM